MQFQSCESNSWSKFKLSKLYKQWVIRYLYKIPNYEVWYTPLIRENRNHKLKFQLVWYLNDISSSNTYPRPSVSSSFSYASSDTSSCQTGIFWAHSLSCPEPRGYHEALAVSAFGWGIPPLFLEPKEASEIVDDDAVASCFFVQMSKFADSEFYSGTG